MYCHAHLLNVHRTEVTLMMSRESRGGSHLRQSPRRRAHPKGASTVWRHTLKKNVNAG